MQNQEEELPALDTNAFAAAIYVPITENLLTSFTYPETRIERLRAILTELETHTAKVRENILAVSNRERNRMLQYTLREERKLTPEQRNPPIEPLSKAEEDWMIGNMEAPYDTLNPAIAATTDGDIRMQEHVELPAARSPQEFLTRMLVEIGSFTLGQLESYDMHVKEMKGFYEGRLKQELEREEVGE